ncbi:ABC transporter permease subunit [Haloarchaeobius sp. HME9146]|uniref:ABC transporter permease n=1 Tax=Haloarchaeobius sp. HME9146 TaxID=2978732 RepID=UPI0021C11FB3|nr:ABC transporter permease subunit [Haloarchaeobius sp. HME9146]
MSRRGLDRVLSLRKTLRIARWEVARSAGTLDRQTVALALVLVAVGAIVGPTVVAQGPGLDDGIYRVGVEEDSPYHDVVTNTSQFVARPDDASAAALKSGEIDVLIPERGEPIPRPTRKGQAAYAEFRTAVQEYNDQLMGNESNQSAAFPVDVSLQYESRAGSALTGGAGSGGGTGDNGGSGGDAGTGGAAGGGSDGGQAAVGGGDDGQVQAPRLGGSAIVSGSTSGSPSNISPPFPFASLVLAFLFIVPMNFIIQAYGSTIINERINRRGELMLVSPVSRRDIIAGKTLPYLAALLVITVAIAILIGGTAVSVAAVLPIALLFLSATFVGGMFARSFKELTFVTITVSVFMTSYVFVPAIFTDVTPIALISPLTLVVMDLQNEAVTLGEYTFSTLPFYLTSLALFTFGAGTYREEDMFSQRPVHQKALDAIATRVRNKKTVALVTALFLPFVFVAELLAIAVLFIVPPALSVPVLFGAIALIEETAKSIHVYAGFEYARFERSPKTAVVLGLVSGFAFFVAEKLTLLVQLVQLQELTLGQRAYPEAAATDPVVVLGLLLLPLGLHTVTATISALGAQRSKRAYAAAFLLAVVVHVAYNMGVTQLVP